MSDFSSFLKDYGSAIPWLIAATGWIVANKQANTREVRKEVRGEIDDLTKIAKSIVAETQKYYATTVGTDDALQCELIIKSSFKELDMRVDRLHSRRLDEFPVGGSLVANAARESFFDLVTGKHFETSSRPATNERVELVGRQTHASLQLAEALHAQFLREFS